MRIILLITAATLGLTLLNSCKLNDDRESKVQDYLQQRVTSESKGVLKLDNFKKVNGYDQDIMGMKIYVLEWEAYISTQQEIWKGGNGFEGYWQSFDVMTKQPGFWDGFLAGSPRHFGVGASIRLTGESKLQKTEQGWRVEELSVLTTQTLNEGSDSDNSNLQANSALPEKKDVFNQSDANAQHILQGKWYGTIGKKSFTLDLEKVGGGQVSGYNIAGTNQRPVTGTYSFYHEGGACTLVLKEPGDNKWDGTFNIEMDALSDNWGGGGTWRAFNGQISNPVSFSRRPPDDPNDFVASSSSTNAADEFIGIWIDPNKNELKISKSGVNFKVTYHPYQDYFFDLVGYYKNGVIKCPHGQDNNDTTVISLVSSRKVKFVGDWENGPNPGPETYYFTK